jgi:hypothetical protein
MPIGNTRIEDAAICSKCKKLGILTKSHGTQDDHGRACDVAVYTCDNEECERYQSGWIVQSTPDGRVYDRERGRDGKIQKTYPRLTVGDLKIGEKMVEQARREDLRHQTEQREEPK